jgi:hypothetical protein
MDSSDTNILDEYLKRTKHCSISSDHLWTIINDSMNRVNGMGWVLSCSGKFSLSLGNLPLSHQQSRQSSSCRTLYVSPAGTNLIHQQRHTNCQRHDRYLWNLCLSRVLHCPSTLYSFYTARLHKSYYQQNGSTRQSRKDLLASTRGTMHTVFATT